MTEICLVESVESQNEAFDVMRELRPQFTLDTFRQTIDRMVHNGYRLVAVRHGGRVVAVAGFRVGESLAWGKHLYIDDLVTREDARSGGYGSMLIEWLEAHAHQQGCAAVHLDSGVQRHGAHRFYLRERFDIVFYHFRKELKA